MGRYIFPLLCKPVNRIHTCSRLLHYHRMSHIYQPINLKPEQGTGEGSLSQKLLVDMGIISLRSSGMYAFLPLGQRVLEKLTALIDEEMQGVGAQKISLPLLTPGQLWRKTGRWDEADQELIRVQDRHQKDYVLSPTHEEAITQLLAETVPPVSHKRLPLRLYQIGSKFRDEMRPCFGLLRCREFVMKDLYTFDHSEAAAATTYHHVCGAYDQVFHKLGIPVVKVAGACGNIGGSFSQEYHYQAGVGEDVLWLCGGCGQASNAELVPDPTSPCCVSCGAPVKKVTGIEVGHTFMLGTKYSRPLRALYMNERGKTELLQMGCYGLGVSRILAATVEVLSRPGHITWPWPLAPFKVCLIGPKKGSSESQAEHWVYHLYQVLNSLPSLHDDVLLDDRDGLTIGRRVVEAKRMGYPHVVVVAKGATQVLPTFELISVGQGTTLHLSHHQLLSYFSQLCNN